MGSIRKNNYFKARKIGLGGLLYTMTTLIDSVGRVRKSFKLLISEESNIKINQKIEKQYKTHIVNFQLPTLIGVASTVSKMGGHLRAHLLQRHNTSPITPPDERMSLYLKTKRHIQ